MVTLIVIIPVLVALILAVLPGPSEESAREWAGLGDATVRRRAIQSAYRPMVTLAAAGVVAPGVLLAVVAMQIDPAASDSSTSLSAQVRDGRWGDPADGTFVFAHRNLAAPAVDDPREPDAAALTVRDAMVGAWSAGTTPAVDDTAGDVARVSASERPRNSVSDHVHAVEHTAWLPNLGIGYTVGLDGPAIVHVSLTLLLAFAAIALTLGPGPLARAGAPMKAQLMLTLGLVSALSLAWCAMDLALMASAWILAAMLGVALVALPALTRARGPAAPTTAADGDEGADDEAAATAERAMRREQTDARTGVTLLALSWAIAAVLLVVTVGLIAAASNEVVDGGTFTLPALAGLAQPADGPDTGADGPGAGASAAGLRVPVAALVTLLLAFALMLPVFPLHHPLLRAIATAPTPTALLLGGAVCALALLLVLRVAAPLMPAWTEASPEIATVFALLGVATVLIAGCGALASATSARADGLPRALALIAVATFGFEPLLLALGSEAGLASALLHSVGHGVAVALLFVCGRAVLARRTGAVYDAAIVSSADDSDEPGANDDASEAGARAAASAATSAEPPARRAPWAIAAFGLALLSISGMPGFCLFASNLSAAVAVLQPNATLDGGVLVICIVAVSLGALATALACLRLFLDGAAGVGGARSASSPPAGDAARLSLRDDSSDLTLWEWIALTPLLVVAVALGFVPALVTDWIGPIVNALSFG